MVDLNKWYNQGQKKSSPKKGYWRGFSAALSRGRMYNKAAAWNHRIGRKKYL